MCTPTGFFLFLLIRFAAPWDEGWQYRKEITIDPANGGTDLTNFPVLLAITDADLAGEALANGDDILFTGDDGATKLDHEIESYAAGDLVAWVRVPNLSSSTHTVVYLYYGNPGAPNQENSSGGVGRSLRDGPALG